MSEEAANNPVTADDIAMVGSLDSWPLVELLSWLHNGRKTAIVRVGEGLEAGMVFLSQGFLYRAEWGQLRGEQALIAMMGLNAGAFSIMHRSVNNAAPNIRTQTGELLLRCAVARDELARAPASA